MTKTIDTLIEDMKEVLLKGVEEIPPEIVKEFAEDLAKTMASKLTTPKEERKPGLYMSNVGSPCERKLWLEINQPAEREPLGADVKFKFLYGDLLESLLIFVAKVAGHKVEGQQDLAELHGVRGRRDVVIDGHLVDVKSASSYSYKKFSEGKLRDDDAFGYYPQLMSYLESAQDDPIVVEKNKAAFLAVDKTLGHFCLDWHERPDWDWEQVMTHKKDMIASPDIPERSFDPVPMGKSGNMKLGTFCAYCSVKEACHEGLRTFLYSTGPVFLTEVVDAPRVYEKVKGTVDAPSTP